MLYVSYHVLAQCWPFTRSYCIINWLHQLDLTRKYGKSKKLAIFTWPFPFLRKTEWICLLIRNIFRFKFALGQKCYIRWVHKWVPFAFLFFGHPVLAMWHIFLIANGGNPKPTGGQFVCAYVNMFWRSATKAFSANSFCSLFSRAEWSILFRSYVRQTCSLRYEGISPINVSLLWPRCRPWEDSISWRNCGASKTRWRLKVVTTQHFAHRKRSVR